MGKKEGVSRRQFLKIAGVGAAGMGAARFAKGVALAGQIDGDK